MKKKILIAFTAAAALMLALTACDSLQKTETSGSGSNVSAPVQTADGTNTIQSSADPNTVDQNQAAGTQNTQNTPAAEEPVGEIIPDEDADAADNDSVGADSTTAADSWSGSYISDDETVNITLLDETTISFAFAQSGISGTAAVNGMQAVYNGDDHYVVVFNLNGTILDISVSNEEDYDASESPLNGTYMIE